MAISFFSGKKTAALALAALTIGAGVTMNSGEAEARFGRKGIAAAGIIGALAVGALVASSHNNRAHAGYYANPGYDYAPAYVPQPVYQQQVYYGEPEYYGQQAYHYGAPRHHGWRQRHRQVQGNGDAQSYAFRGPRCKLTRQQVWNGYGYEVHRAQVCR